MAINLKEIFEGDSDFIKVEKINYNFDQILSNGGGPIGPQGTTGIPGLTGSPGNQGNQGPQGFQGAPGQDGQSTDAWDRDETYLNIPAGPTEYFILRPFSKVDDVIGSPTYGEETTTRVILGDDKVNQANDPTNDIPQYDPQALLSLVRKTPATTFDAEKQLEFLNIDSGSLKSQYKIYSEYDSITTTSTLKLDTINANTTKVWFDGADEFRITGDDVIISSNTNDVRINGNDNVIVNSNNESQFNGSVASILYSPNLAYVWSDALVQIGKQKQTLVDTNTANLKLLADTILVGNTSGNSTKSTYSLRAKSVLETVDNNSEEIIGGNKIIGSTNLQLTQSLDATIQSVNNTVSASNNNLITSDVLNKIYTTSGENIVETFNGTNILKNGIIDNFKTENGLNTSDETIFFSDTDGVHTSPSVGYYISTNNTTTGDGVRWKEGGAQSGTPGVGSGAWAAPNNGSAPEFRTQSDYYWTAGTGNSGSQTLANRTTTGYGGLTNSPSGGQLSALPLGTASTPRNRYDYVKVGNLINCWGLFSSRTTTAWDTLDIDGSLVGAHLCIDLGGAEVFPYVNDMSQIPARVEVNISTQFSNNLNLAEASNPAGETGTSWGFFGLIYPGDNVIYLYKNIIRAAGGEPLWTMPLTPKDIQVDSGNANTTQNFAISWSFSMPTGWNSYNQITTSSGQSQYKSGEGGNVADGGDLLPEDDTGVKDGTNLGDKSSISIVSTFTGPGIGGATAPNRDTDVTYTADENTTGVTYQWAVSGGWTIVSGQGTKNLVVNFDNAMELSGSIQLTTTLGDVTSTTTETISPVTNTTSSTVTLNPSSGIKPSNGSGFFTVDVSVNGASGWSATPSNGLITVTPDTGTTISSPTTQVTINAGGTGTVTFDATSGGGSATFNITEDVFDGKA